MAEKPPKQTQDFSAEVKAKLPEIVAVVKAVRWRWLAVARMPATEFVFVFD